MRNRPPANTASRLSLHRPAFRDSLAKTDQWSRRMVFEPSPLPDQPAFGAVVTGLTGADIDDPAVGARLRELWIDRGVLVFRGLEQSRDTHVRLSRIFGTLLNHEVIKDTPGQDPEV